MSYLFLLVIALYDRRLVVPEDGAGGDVVLTEQLDAGLVEGKAGNRSYYYIKNG